MRYILISVLHVKMESIFKFWENHIVINVKYTGKKILKFLNIILIVNLVNTLKGNLDMKYKYNNI